MKQSASILFLSFVTCTQMAPAGQGPAGASGACSHVIGPVDGSGIPIGFTCTDVGGNALLVWNASQLSSAISVSGGIKTVNFYPGDFTVSGVFKSDGALAFIGGGITVSGSITGSSVLIVGASTTAAEVSSKLMGPAPSSIVCSNLQPVVVEQTGKVTANSGNVMIAGQNIQNFGRITAASHSAVLKTGTRLNIGWDDIKWEAGKQSIFNDLSIANRGSIKASDIVLEAQRFAGNTSIFNSGILNGTNSITFVTGTPGNRSPDGSYQPETFGIVNEPTGKLYSPSIVITQYYQADPGGSPKPETFDTRQIDRRIQVRTDLGTGIVFPTQDNTPAGTSAVVNDTFSPTASTAGTAAPSIVIPQLAVSMTHMNASTSGNGPIILAKNQDPETVRGSANKAAPAQKPRVKAKPVLMRGSFFDSKIKAKITVSG